MLSIEKYKVEDGEEMIERCKKRRKPQQFPDDLAQCYETHGEGFSFFWDGELLGCAGLHDYYIPGVGLAWAMYSLDIGSYHIDPQVVRDKMNEIIKQRGYHRVQVTCRRDFPAGMSYLRYLGFTVEGIMRNHESDGTDLFQYSRVEIQQNKQDVSIGA
jgi:RimJ/RimL family protein N-acetyltransferase